MSAVIVAVTISLAFAGNSSRQQRGADPESVYNYGVAATQLEGNLVKRKVFGPPGYGETPAKDERNTILILKLLRPISVKPTAGSVAKNNPNSEAFQHVREIQLFIPRQKRTEAERMVGKIVLVSGMLNEHVAPSSYTDVWMDVKAITLK